jgi:hypothetical protein
MRYAGDIAMTGLMGAGGAMLADRLAHSPMDRLAQEYQDNVKGPVEQGNQAFQNVFNALRSEVQSGVEQEALIRTLSAGAESIPGEVMEVLSQSPRSLSLVRAAQQVRDQSPAAAIAMARISLQETQLLMKEREAGVTPQEVVQARGEGAGVSPVPALLGGAAIGGGTAALAALARRRNGGDPFRVKRTGP